MFVVISEGRGEVQDADGKDNKVDVSTFAMGVVC